MEFSSMDGLWSKITLAKGFRVGKTLISIIQNRVFFKVKMVTKCNFIRYPNNKMNPS